MKLTCCCKLMWNCSFILRIAARVQFNPIKGTSAHLIGETSRRRWGRRNELNHSRTPVEMPKSLLQHLEANYSERVHCGNSLCCSCAWWYSRVMATLNGDAMHLRDQRNNSNDNSWFDIISRRVFSGFIWSTAINWGPGLVDPLMGLMVVKTEYSVITSGGQFIC